MVTHFFVTVIEICHISVTTIVLESDLSGYHLGRYW